MEVQIYHVMQPGVLLGVDSQFPLGPMVRPPWTVEMEADDRNRYHQ